MQCDRGQSCYEAMVDGFRFVYVCVCLCMCGNTFCANSRREKLYISMSWHNCCNLKFVDKLFIHEFFKLCCTFLSHLSYCIFHYITDHSLMEIITELHKKKKNNNTVFLSNMPRIARAYLENMTYNLSIYIYIYILFNFLLIFYILYNNIIKVSLINKLVKKAMCSFGQRF